MSTDDEESRVAGWLLAGARSLSAGDAEAALGPLEQALAHEGFAAARELDDVRARALSLLAQARLGAGDLAGADEAAMAALRLVRAQGDADGLADVRALHARVREARAAASRDATARASLERLAAVPLSELRARATSPFALADLLVQRANAEMERGDADTAADLSDEALTLATSLGDVRLEVLARLSLARARPEIAEEQLCAALARADAADEFNLVGAIARAAAAQDVALPHQHGPTTASSGDPS